MKSRVISILLTAVLMLSLMYTAVNARNYENLTAIGVNTENSADEYITRGEFAYIAARILSQEDKAPVDTKFDDVKENNANSGYIDYLYSQNIINGISETQFVPEAFVSSTAAAKIIVHILGFDAIAENIGGYPDGYIKTASKLNLFEHAPLNSEKLTFVEAMGMFESMLLANSGHNDFVIKSSEEGISIEFYNSDRNFLTSRLCYSVYKGIVESSEAYENTVNFTVTKNVYESNYNKLTEGSTVSLKAIEKVDVAHYEGANVKVWLNSHDEIIYMMTDNSCEISYGYIYSVNGDDEKNSVYLTDTIERIALSGEKKDYDLAEAAEIYLNGTAAPSSVKLAGSFAKVITDGNDVLRLYCWNMTEGGLIQNINSGEKEISYIRGESGIQKWDKSEDSKLLTVYIDGRLGEFEEIKANSVFDYYFSEERCIISVSERISVDIFGGYSNDEIRIGAFDYKYSDTWFSTDGKVFKQDSTTIKKLINSEVAVYFAPNGYASYVVISDGEIEKKSFYGIVSGVNLPTGLKKDIEIEIFCLGETIETLRYTMTDKTKFNDGLTAESIALSYENLAGEGVYYFTANSKGRITSVEKCKAFTGYGAEAKATVSAFSDDILPMITLNGKQLYFQNTDIVAIYNDNGDFAAKYLPWSSLYGRVISGSATISFYSQEEGAQPDIAVLCGDVMNIIDDSLSLGVVVGKRFVRNEDDDFVCQAEILSNTGRLNFIVSDSTAQKLSLDDFVVYNRRTVDSKEQMSISEITPMSGDITQWQTSLTATSGLQRGIVRKIDSKRLYIEADNDEIYFMHPYSCLILEADSENSDEKFTSVTTAEINSGDTVCYYIYGGELRAIIVQK